MNKKTSLQLPDIAQGHMTDQVSATLVEAAMNQSSRIANAMTVDVEDYFQVSAFEPHINRDSWQTINSRVCNSVDRILQLFDDKNVQATFFTLGWLAERYPEMVKKIVANGHEIASHGWAHVRVTMQNNIEFAEDVSRTKKLLEDISGEEVKGYRAASYSIGRENLWALSELAKAGYSYSSSIAPVRHDHYGMVEAPRFRFEAAEGKLIEIPITTVNIAGRNINCAGGGWFRLFPYRFSRWAVNHVNRVEEQPAVFYFHPWEIDPEQPRLSGLGLKTGFRHYFNLSRMYNRLEQLLSDFTWQRMDAVFFND